MRFLRDLPIRKKLRWTIMLACSAALILAELTFVGHEVLSERATLVNNMVTLGDVIGVSSTAALAFHDPAAATDRLAALKADPRVVAAFLLDDQGAVLATYGSSDATPGADDGPPRWQSGRLTLSRPVVLEGERVGTVVLEADLTHFYGDLTRFVMRAGGVLILCLLVALVLATMLANVISQPLLNLAETAGRVSADGDYSLRATRWGKDELGHLVDRFNEMLERIELREQEGAETRDQLEERVAERTREIRQSEWWLRTILGAIDDGVVATDSLGSVTFLNAAALELTGRSRSDALGSPVGQVLRLEGGMRISPSDTDGEGLEVPPRMRTATLIDSTGVQRPVEYRATLIPHEPGGEAGTVVVFRDITHRREAEEATALQRLRVLVENLPQGVAYLAPGGKVMLANPHALERLRLLAGIGPGDQLEQLGGKSLAELLQAPEGGGLHQVTYAGDRNRTFQVIATTVRSDEEILGHTLVLREVTEELETRRRLAQQDRLVAVGQLAAGIAHDFNNILQAITGYAELVRMQPDLPRRLVNRIDDITGQGKRGAKLIRQILDFSRKSITERQPMNLAPFLAETIKMLRSTIPESIRITTDIAKDGCVALVDPTQVQQLVTNLAVNARDAMPGGGELHIRLARERLDTQRTEHLPRMEAGDWICLSIRDTGTGIPEDVQPRVYEPFFTTKPATEGTGLGLAQVYGIVKQQDGYIDFESKEGEGATFYVFLPPVNGPPQDVTPSGEFPAIGSGRGRRVLVVEDQPMVLTMTKEILETFGFKVLTAETGEQALRLYERHHDEIDLVVSDMVMPEMGGLELSRRLRGLNPEVRLVLMSGYPLGEDVRDQLSTSRLRWISKPFTARQLGQLVVEVVSDSR